MLTIPKDYLTTAQVAQELGVDQDTVYAWIKRSVRTPSGRVYLAALRVGLYRIAPESIRQFIEAQNPGVHIAAAERDDAARRADREAGERLEKRFAAKDRRAKPKAFKLPPG